MVGLLKVKNDQIMFIVQIISLVISNDTQLLVLQSLVYWLLRNTKAWSQAALMGGGKKDEKVTEIDTILTQFDYPLLHRSRCKPFSAASWTEGEHDSKQDMKQVMKYQTFASNAYQLKEKKGCNLKKKRLHQ